MDISRIYKSKTRKALFTLYFTNPENDYYLRELERVLHIPVSMIRNELVNLEREGIFLSQRKGNLLYYSINKEYPLFLELKSIVFKTVGITGTLRQMLSEIGGVKTAFIYGSFAKKSENAASDIDLFILGDIDEDRLSGGLRRIEDILKREINYTLYSKRDFLRKKKTDSFLKNIIDNPKIFLIGDKNEL